MDLSTIYSYATSKLKANTEYIDGGEINKQTEGEKKPMLICVFHFIYFFSWWIYWLGFVDICQFVFIYHFLFHYTFDVLVLLLFLLSRFHHESTWNYWCQTINITSIRRKTRHVHGNGHHSPYIHKWIRLNWLVLVLQCNRAKKCLTWMNSNIKCLNNIYTALQNMYRAGQISWWAYTGDERRNYNR